MKNGCVYESWAIVASVRTARGPRQRTITTLGKGPEYAAEERVGWDDVVDQLSGRFPAKQARLFGSTPEAPTWAEVDLRKVGVERLRRFGDVLLALLLWKQLRLDVFFGDVLPEGREEAHIFIAFLALCLRRSLALWMERSGLGTAPKKLLEEMRQIHSLDVILTAKKETEIRLRVVSTPEESTRVLLHKLGSDFPIDPKSSKM